MLSWIRSFLCKRVQCVNVDGAKSEWKKVVSGIPQGSVIGPLLIVIFINDMPESVKYNICKLFSDDCKLYGTVNKSSENLKTFWLVDPIDGTHDYINDKDEFTINAGLIINNKPEIGIIYAPAKRRLFYGYHEGKCFELINNKENKLNCNKLSKQGTIKAVSYSNKLIPIIDDWHKKFKVTEHVKMKSSLKFCVIATGEYDLYVAEPRAREWDIAAGHAIVKNAGGLITDFENNEILYGKKQFKNPSLILKRSSLL